MSRSEQKIAFSRVCSQLLGPPKGPSTSKRPRPPTSYPGNPKAGAHSLVANCMAASRSPSPERSLRVGMLDEAFDALHPIGFGPNPSRQISGQVAPEASERKQFYLPATSFRTDFNSGSGFSSIPMTSLGELVDLISSSNFS